MKYRDSWYPDREHKGASAVINAVVDDAPDYYDGELESAAARLNKLIEVVAAIVDTLPESDQQCIIAEVASRWKLIE